MRIATAQLLAELLAGRDPIIAVKEAEVSLYQIVRDAEAELPDAHPLDVARRIVKRMKAAERDEALADLIADYVSAARRVRVRQIERDASQRVVIEQAEHRRQRWASSWPAEPEMLKNLADIRDARFSLPSKPHPRRRDYAEWAASPEAEERARLVAILDRREAEIREVLDRKREDYRITREEHEAEQAERARLRIEDPAEYERRFTWWGMLTDAMERFRQEVRLELTQELLGSTFALGDGRSVTWGEATQADHEGRITFLMRNVEGNMQTIAIHDKAIAVMREAGVRCLNDVRQPVAA